MATLPPAAHAAQRCRGCGWEESTALQATVLGAWPPLFIAAPRHTCITAAAPLSLSAAAPVGASTLSVLECSASAVPLPASADAVDAARQLYREVVWCVARAQETVGLPGSMASWRVRESRDGGDLWLFAGQRFPLRAYERRGGDGDAETAAAAAEKWYRRTALRVGQSMMMAATAEARARAGASAATSAAAADGAMPPSAAILGAPVLPNHETVLELDASRGTQVRSRALPPLRLNCIACARLPLLAQDCGDGDSAAAVGMAGGGGSAIGDPLAALRRAALAGADA